MANSATTFDASKDGQLAALLEVENKAQRDVLVVANGFTVRIARRASSNAAWVDIARGDLGDLAAQEARKIAKAKRLYWQTVHGSPLSFDISQAAPVQTETGALNAWLKAVSGLCLGSGRGEMPKSAELSEYALDAGWRCQFPGCGKDLRRHGPTGTKSKSSYYAHIVASSPDGPRGDQANSHALSTDINNIILLCDECHRLIDREDPDFYDVQSLKQMRADGSREVQRLLDTLTFQIADVMIVMGNITGQSSQFSVDVAEQAMWLRKLRAAPRHAQRFFENSWTQHNPHSRDYWNHFFTQARAEIVQLRKYLASPGSGRRERLAVFPLHGTSILLLAGRLFGEAVAPEIFQYRRNRSTALMGGPWGYSPEDDTGQAFAIDVLRERVGGESEACLIVSLTFDLDPGRLPTELWNSSNYQLPTLRVRPQGDCGHDCIKHPNDLDRVSKVLSDAVARLQDTWKVTRVHLIVGAPASVAFKMGQKLQARHQAEYVCYESPNGGGTASTFLPTIVIGGERAWLATDPALTLDLA